MLANAGTAAVADGRLAGSLAARVRAGGGHRPGKNGMFFRRGAADWISWVAVATTNATMSKSPALTWVTPRPDGVVGVGAEDGSFFLVDLVQQRVLHRIACGAFVARSSWSPDGRLFVARLDGQLQVRRGDDLATIAELDTRHGRLLGFAIDARGTIVATCGEDGVVRLWDATSLLPRLELRDGKVAAHSVAFAGDHIVAGYADGFCVGWRADGPTKVVSRQLLTSAVYSLGAHPSGQRLVAAGSKGGLQELVVGPPGAWQTGRTWRVPPRPIAGNAIAFAADGRFVVACSDDTAMLFASTDEALERVLGRPFHWRQPKPEWTADFIVSGACFLPGTEWVVTSHFDGQLRWWQGTTQVGALSPFTASGQP